ncbi:hypothetical protein KSF_039020 [Reticulibacter mediterranei]|uniref:Uncharacterized protein n=1 Tax=Reticulibacter mediterranei TaxID=2778369 RepID=A0A8J3IEG0_9CHLR|nr:hypothetical protein KSF_039020 [Reticulibacter mediterranei]
MILAAGAVPSAEIACRKGACVYVCGNAAGPQPCHTLLMRAKAVLMADMVLQLNMGWLVFECLFVWGMVLWLCFRLLKRVRGGQ